MEDELSLVRGDLEPNDRVRDLEVEQIERVIIAVELSRGREVAMAERARRFAQLRARGL